MGYFNDPGPGEKRNGIFTAAAVFLALAWITLSLRIWVRTAILRSLGWDDGLLLFSAIIFTGYCTVVVMVETSGGAPTVNELSFDELNRLVGMVVASFELYIATMIFFKISLGIFYLRIVIRSWQRYVVHTVVLLNTVYGVFLFIIALFNCGDPSKYLEHEIAGICTPADAIYGLQLAGCIINAVTDWVFAILPVFILFKATMPLAAKVSAGLILLIACCGSVVSIVRIQYIKGLEPGPDFFNTAIDLCIWSIVECGLGISAASSATFRPLFRGLMTQPRVNVSAIFSYTPHSKGTQDTSNNTQISEHISQSSAQPMEELRDLESQNQNSHFSTWSMGPVLKNSRVMGKLGLSHETTREERGSPLLPPSPPVPPPPPPPVPPKPPKPTARELVRQKSQKVRAKMSGGRSTPERPQFAQQESIRDRGISRPMPHIMSQMCPASTSLSLPPSATGDQPRLTAVDQRRGGSPDWTTQGNARVWPPPQEHNDGLYYETGHRPR